MIIFAILYGTLYFVSHIFDTGMKFTRKDAIAAAIVIPSSLFLYMFIKKLIKITENWENN